jgi:hypothetical protein
MSPDFATWGSPKTLLAANALSGINYTGYNNHTILPILTGGWIMCLEAVGTANSGVIHTIALTSPNLTDNGDGTVGTWTYSSAITTALAVIGTNGGANLVVNSPGVMQYGTTTYLIHRVNGALNFIVATTDTTNYTTVTVAGDPVMEPTLAADELGIDDPRFSNNGSYTYIFHTLGSNFGNGGKNAIIGVAWYQGTPDKLMATGTVTINNPQVPPASAVSSGTAFGPDANGATAGTASSGGGGNSSNGNMGLSI